MSLCWEMVVCQDGPGKSLPYLLHGRVRWHVTWLQSVLEGWELCLTPFPPFSPSTVPLPLFPSTVYASPLCWPSFDFTHRRCHLSFPSLIPPLPSPISTHCPSPLLIVLASSLFIRFHWVCWLCLDLRAARFGYCSQRIDFLDLIFYCYIATKIQYQDVFMKCWLYVVLFGRQNILSNRLCKNLVGQIRPRCIKS